MPACGMLLQQVVFVVLTAVQTAALRLGRMPGSAPSFPGFVGCVSLVLIELL